MGLPHDNDMMIGRRNLPKAGAAYLLARLCSAEAFAQFAKQNEPPTILNPPIEVAKTLLTVSVKSSWIY